MSPPVGHASRRRFLALGIALGAGLSAGEVLVRAWFGVALEERLPLLEMRAHPTRGWSMVPSQDHFTYRHVVHVNTLGLRGAQVGPRRPGCPRVLALGDSLVYGQGVAEAETLPAYLQAELRRDDPAGRAWEVINGGHRAYDTGQELALFEELGASLRPDAVVLFWYWNDLVARDVAATYARLSGRGTVAFDTGRRMEGLALLSWELRQLLRRSALAMYAHDLLPARRSGQASDPVAWEAGLARLDGQLQRLRDAVGELGGVLVFCAVPDRRALLGEHPSTALAERALELAARRGIAAIDLAPALRALARSTGEVPVLPFDGHYRPEANRAMAEVVAGLLLAP